MRRALRPCALRGDIFPSFEKVYQALELMFVGQAALEVPDWVESQVRDYSWTSSGLGRVQGSRPLLDKFRIGSSPRFEATLGQVPDWVKSQVLFHINSQESCLSHRMCWVLALYAFQ